jgi:myo-inositol-1(or 4)-monophosphatase
VNRMNKELNYAVKLAKHAGVLLKGNYQSGGIKGNFKSDHSLVTKADIEIDKLITDELKNQFPDDLLLSEELFPRYHSGSELTHRLWVIDPLDGTTNFTLGLPFWGISLALLENGRPALAVINFPMLNELFTAVRGKGAHLNGSKLRIQPDKYKETSFFTCCSRTFRRYKVEIPYKTRILGCASYTFCSVARNSAVLGFEATPKVWDIAAAWLVIEETGGKISLLDGTDPFPLNPEIDYASQSFPTIAAGTTERFVWGKQRIKPR